MSIDIGIAYTMSAVIKAMQSDLNVSWADKAKLLAPEVSTMCENFQKGSQSASGVQAFIWELSQLRALNYGNFHFGWRDLLYKIAITHIKKKYIYIYIYICICI